jgi:hypothetical protein
MFRWSFWKLNAPAEDWGVSQVQVRFSFLGKQDSSGVTESWLHDGDLMMSTPPQCFDARGSACRVGIECLRAARYWGRQKRREQQLDAIPPRQHPKRKSSCTVHGSTSVVKQVFMYCTRVEAL